LKPLPLLAGAAMLAGCSAAPSPSAAPTPETLTVLQLDRMTVDNGRGQYVGEQDGRKARIAYDVPIDRIDPVRGHGSDRIGATRDGVVVLVDRYATKASGPDDRCAADGREAWIRAFSLATAREIAAIPLESCRNRVPAADVNWVEPNQFRIETRPARVYTINGESLTAS
jgi:hypothetical protein